MQDSTPDSVRSVLSFSLRCLALYLLLIPTSTLGFFLGTGDFMITADKLLFGSLVTAYAVWLPALVVTAGWYKVEQCSDASSAPGTVTHDD